MKFEILEKKEFEKFASKHTYTNFLQSSKMEPVYKLSNWEVEYVGVKEENKIIAATLLLSMKNKMKQRYFYAPRGILLDYENDNLITFFISEIKDYAKSKNGYTIKFDPIIPRIERDINGEILDNGFNNEVIVEKLKNFSCKHLGYDKGTDISKQVRWVFQLNLENKTKEEVFSKFKPNVRNYINKAIKNGIEIEKLNYEDLKIFKNITSDTSKRIGFSDKSLEYYQEMYKAFSKTDNVKFLVAKLNLNKYLSNLNVELTETKQKLQETPDKFSKQGVRKQLEKEISSLEKRIQETYTLKKEAGETLILSGAMFMIYGNEITYLFSGNYEKYMNFNAQYLIQWHMIQYAIEKNILIYNFYGISGIFDKENKDYGVYEFKKGFDGNVVEYIGEFEIIVNKQLYNFINFIHILKKYLIKIKTKIKKNK